MRVMPNLGVEVGKGVLCFAAASGVDDALSRHVVDLLESLGRVEVIDDDLIDLATAVMGCSPAYLALVLDALATATAARGLDLELARSLAIDTAAGTAELLRTRTPAELIAAVASPGGSTEAGLEALERERAKDAFAAAVAASLARMRGDA
jgi:pyrroline-5-carboxylate reductase